jgi:hypothetical protein
LLSAISTVPTVWNDALATGSGWIIAPQKAVRGVAWQISAQIMAQLPACFNNCWTIFKD